MNFKIKRKEFTPEVVGMYFTAQGDTAYKVVYIEDGDIRFAYFDHHYKGVVISGVKFKIPEFYKSLSKGSLIQIDPSDHMIPLALLSYEAKPVINVQI